MNKNFKTEFFEENGKQFMKLEFDHYDICQEKYHFTIHKIDMNNINLERTYPLPNKLRLDIYPIENGELFTMVETTEYKEMTLRDIENKLGYKIKLKSK